MHESLLRFQIDIVHILTNNTKTITYNSKFSIEGKPTPQVVKMGLVNDSLFFKAYILCKIRFNLFDNNKVSVLFIFLFKSQDPEIKPECISVSLAQATH